MDDKNLTKLFGDFNPELPSDFDFIHRLQQRLDTVEIVRQEQSAMQRRNRLALIIAAGAGFIMGVILTLLYPLFTRWITIIELSGHITTSSATCYTCAAWLLMAILSVATAMNSYELALARLKRKK